MSFLYPLFLAGLALVGLPILLHLIRRATRQPVTFSSLMFLRASAPRFQRRRHLQNLPLLLLRCLILCLLAAAFARPFFRHPAPTAGAHAGDRWVLLLDASASMRRGDLWNRSVQAAQDLMANISRKDSVCIYRFARDSRPVVGFETWRALAPDQRVQAACAAVAELGPTWQGTHLDQALIRAVEVLEEDAAADTEGRNGTDHIVLISDLQQGSHLKALQAYEWPDHVNLRLHPITAAQSSNASLQWVTGRRSLAGNTAHDRPKVRVTNSANAITEQFQLHWQGDASALAPEATTDVYVAPGRSTLVSATQPADPNTGQVMALTGDAHDFDNQLYVAPAAGTPIDILYWGSDDPNDTRGLYYYLRRAYQNTGQAQIRVTARAGTVNLDPTQLHRAHLVVVADRLAPQNARLLRQALEQGQTVWMVLTSAEMQDTLRRLTGIPDVSVEKASPEGYAMLEQLDLSHPLFVPFAEPHLGDFTRLHVWSYQRLVPQQLPDARVLAWFDTRDPAWLETAVGRGTLLIWTLSWQTAQSDLALSSKFVPLLYSILEHSGALVTQEAQYTIGAAVPVTPRAAMEADAVTIVKPDASSIRLASQQPIFGQTDLPGFYRVESSRAPRTFAVNMPHRESQTAPLDPADLEKLGLRISTAAPQAAGAAKTVRPQLHRAQIEASQRIWHKLLFVALLVLLLEIWLGGWLARQKSNASGEPT